MSEFVYLYRGGEAGRSPEAAQQVMQKWMTWLKDLGEKGVNQRVCRELWTRIVPVTIAHMSMRIIAARTMCLQAIPDFRMRERTRCIALSCKVSPLLHPCHF